VRNAGVAIQTGTSCSAYDPHNTSSRYLNSAAFSTPAPFTLGNVCSLASTRTCRYENENLSLVKRFQVTEKVQFKLSGNFFNLFNRHTWTGISSDINNSGTFGRYSGATTPRIVQLNARIEF